MMSTVERGGEPITALLWLSPHLGYTAGGCRFTVQHLSYACPFAAIMALLRSTGPLIDRRKPEDRQKPQSNLNQAHAKIYRFLYFGSPQVLTITVSFYLYTMSLYTVSYSAPIRQYLASIFSRHFAPGPPYLPLSPSWHRPHPPSSSSLRSTTEIYQKSMSRVQDAVNVSTPRYCQQLGTPGILLLTFADLHSPVGPCLPNSSAASFLPSPPSYYSQQILERRHRYHIGIFIVSAYSRIAHATRVRFRADGR